MTAEIAVERKLSLFEIEQSLQILMQDRDEVTDPEEIAAVEAAIQEYVRKEVRKVDGIRSYIRHGEMMVAGAKEEAARASAVAKAWQDRIDRLKAHCLAIMQETGAKRLDGRAGYLVVKGNGGVAPLNLQADLLPAEYQDVTLTLPRDVFMRLAPMSPELAAASVQVCAPATARIREALKSGPVPGAYLGERGQHLEVK